ncbi:DNA polymerase epsilon subunit B [Aspergillus awamori]|uniref:DNA polymerase epsilon subunit B n=2 Tax=Aspergillus TaxID=5052 RepID=A0A3F3PTC9_9EURO|nr:DNA polymerase alpha/epsilon subunit B-domain-containing protein [Aspergillus welwitschiae]RDH30012.1 DNA polymerase alpha/epsilon subunit B-domain-containing protein [Aspergillus welwitschiae]GCB17880.1 DNA polymerase epsilon subunit B [Aspergillus awamori]GKZ67274.1 DNA-directed DNA polymerase epsilon, subunit B [Aspergillus niger]GLA33430.1 DNA-directed DNA polymerase epsilon, subunit B [Aspergillus niger]
MDSDPVPSSSPGFGTPAYPFRKNRPNALPTRTSVLPILLPPSTLRPVAFRTFTRKHNLTISSSALQTLATFVGKNCGSAWREEGLAERALDEVAKAWKKAGGGVIVDEGKGASLKAILQTLESNMSGGRVISGKHATPDEVPSRTTSPGQGNRRSRADPQLYAAAGLEGEGSAESSDVPSHPRHWVRVIEAFDIPRLTYNADKRYFEVARSRPTLFPPSSHRTNLFRDRYNVIHQRLLRHESFQSPSGPSRILRKSSSSLAVTQGYKLTPIANLLGRNGTSHLILGLLSMSPTGDLNLSDLTGSISLDLRHARMVPEDGAWLAPGMFVLVDGIYEEEENVRGSTLGGNSGVGGAIGGVFVGVSICGPPCERRETSLGMNNQQSGREVSSSGGLGWIDFLGVGSERAQGPRMRHIEASYLRGVHGSAEGDRRLKVAALGEVNLDDMRTLDALRKVFSVYHHLPLEERPSIFVLTGNFVQKAIINSSGQAGSIEYKEHFDALSLILSEFPSLLQHSTFVFVPGDNDPWPSAFSAGAASPIPRHSIPELFTTRVKRAFATANSQLDSSQSSGPPGEAIWTSNPSRLTLFGPVHDIAIFRDDISNRLRRNAVNLSHGADTAMAEDAHASAGETDHLEPHSHSPQTGISSSLVPSTTLFARRLVKSILDQGTLSPFPLSLRPVLWDYVSSLQLYPLPTAIILADPEAAPFCITYEGCHVMNTGRLVPEGELSFVRWVEYDAIKNRGRIQQERL